MESGKETQMGWLEHVSVSVRFGKDASWLLRRISWGKSILRKYSAWRECGTQEVL